ncbi:MAG TPA: glycosyltransferase [Actinomycetes bacterium]|nr:glycosyltransferase [Actinomycetes bacterium]
MDEAAIASRSPNAFEAVIGRGRARAFASALGRARHRQGSHTLWHVNSSAQGGGVAEMLQSILSYLLGAGIECRWLIIDGGEEFFELTKRIHHLLHAEPHDGPSLDARARRTYEGALRADADRIVELIAPGDVVVLNDPQTLGLAPSLRRAGVRLIFTCHIGADRPDEHTRTAWEFLSRYIGETDRQVFSRSQYIWDGLDPENVAVIPPCLDAFSPKNQELDAKTVGSILAAAGLVADDVMSTPDFIRQDGTKGKVSSRAEMIEMLPLSRTTPIVTQVSRWDPLKDPGGVIAGFVAHVPTESGAHLVLAGPAPESVADDPESQQVFSGLREQWRRLPDEQRARVHLGCLPMDDSEQNGAIVNALQRRSDVVVQKSLAEGFGLTVAEAMWKHRATVGSRVGGIQDQIEHGRSGCSSTTRTTRMSSVSRSPGSSPTHRRARGWARPHMSGSPITIWRRNTSRVTSTSSLR